MAASSSPRRKSGARLPASISEHVRARIEEAAAWKGVSVSNFVAEAAAKEAEQVMEKARVLQLSRADSELLLSLLDDPPDPNAALRKAANTYEKIDGG